MYLQSFMKNYRKVRDWQNDEDKYTHIDQENADSSQNETIPEFKKEEIQAAIERLKKGKRKTAVEYVQNK